MFEIVFSFNVKVNNIFPSLHNIKLSCNIQKCFSIFSTECACLHKTVTMVVFFVESNENSYQKGRALMQMYRDVPIKKRGNFCQTLSTFRNVRWSCFPRSYRWVSSGSTQIETSVPTRKICTNCNNLVIVVRFKLRPQSIQFFN